jgi:hypothetical protein
LSEKKRKIRDLKIKLYKLVGEVIDTITELVNMQSSDDEMVIEWLWGKYVQEFIYRLLSRQIGELDFIADADEEDDDEEDEEEDEIEAEAVNE